MALLDLSTVDVLVFLVEVDDMAMRMLGLTIDLCLSQVKCFDVEVVFDNLRSMTPRGEVIFHKFHIGLI